MHDLAVDLALRLGLERDAVHASVPATVAAARRGAGDPIGGGAVGRSGSGTPSDPGTAGGAAP